MLGAVKERRGEARRGEERMTMTMTMAMMMMIIMMPSSLQ